MAKKIVEKNTKDKINYLGFIAVLFLGLLTHKLPDIDLSAQGLIGHRSIITHSILFPFLKNKKKLQIKKIRMLKILPLLHLHQQPHTQVLCPNR